MTEIHVVGRIEWGGIDMRKRVYGVDGIAPTVDTCQGGKKQIKILEGGEEMIKAFAMRGCYNEDGTISQQIEFRKDEVTSTLTGVQKDNMLLDGGGEEMQQVTVNDLFCGAGGMGLGFKQAGFDITGSYDFDKYAIQSYKHNVGDHAEQISINDMTHESMPQADVWTFGFPCQDLSVAGKHAGLFEGKRSGLFFEVMRLLDETKEHDVDKLPKIIMAENVKGLKPYLEVLREEYKQRGYKMYLTDQNNGVFNSKYWGVPQNRERYFVVGVHESIEKEFVFPTQQTEYVPKLLSILEPSVDEKYYISDEKTKSIIEQAKLKLQVANGNVEQLQKASGLLTMNEPGRTLRVGGKGSLSFKHNYEHLTTNELRVRKLTPREYARLQGFPDSFEIVVSDSQAYKQFGNAVSVPVARAIAERIRMFLLSL